MPEIEGLLAQECDKQKRGQVVLTNEKKKIRPLTGFDMHPSSQTLLGCISNSKARPKERSLGRALHTLRIRLKKNGFVATGTLFTARIRFWEGRQRQ